MLESAQPPDHQPVVNGTVPPVDVGRVTLADVLAELRLLRRAVQAQVAGPTEWLHIRGVCALTSLPKSTVYRLIGLGRLPRPAQLGRQARRWSRTEVLRAMQAMVE
jgi:predicted DNA-binding transcriptional regulator AlpA